MQAYNGIFFNPHKDEQDHQRYIQALGDSQDLVQESVTEKQEVDQQQEQQVQEEEEATSAQPQSPEVADAINTVKAILAKQGVAVGSDSSPESIEQLLQQAQIVDQGLKVKNEKKETKVVTEPA